MPSTADRIFALLKEKGVEQKEFAKQIGTTDKTVSAWKTGRSSSYAKYLAQIATILGTTVEYLLTGEKKELTTTSGPQSDILVKFNALSSDDQDEVRAIIELKLAKKNRAP